MHYRSTSGRVVCRRRRLPILCAIRRWPSFDSRQKAVLQSTNKTRQVFSFDDFIPITNESYYAITTRQCNRLYMTRPRTTFSSNLPNHNFVNIWNKFDQIYQKCKPKHKAKKLLRNQFIDSFLNTVRCDNRYV